MVGSGQVGLGPSADGSGQTKVTPANSGVLRL